MEKPIPSPVSLYNGGNEINEQIKLMILNCSKYLKYQMPEKNEQLTAHIFHLSQCTGVDSIPIPSYQATYNNLPTNI